jgi:hypothetical protein
MKFRATVLSNQQGTNMDLVMGKPRRSAKRAVKDLTKIIRQTKGVYWYGIIPYPAPKKVKDALANSIKSSQRKR